MDSNQVLPDVHHFFTKFTIRSVLFTLAAFFFKTLNSLFQLLSKFQIDIRKGTELCCQQTTLYLKDILQTLIKNILYWFSQVGKSYIKLCDRWAMSLQILYLALIVREKFTKRERFIYTHVAGRPLKNIV